MKKEKKLFECEFTEYNGDQEYTHKKLVRANTEEQARRILTKWLRDWYCDDDAEPIKVGNKITGYDFFGGCPIVSKIHVYRETTKEHFMQEAFEAALIEEDNL